MRVMLAAAAHTESSGTQTGFRTGFMTGFGATTAICGLAAYVINKRKSTAIEDGSFMRV